MSYREALENARELFLDPDSSNLQRVAGYLNATAACGLPWNYNRMSFDLNLDSIESLFRMRNHNQQCPGCEDNLVNVLLACNHAYCCSCLFSWQGTETFPDPLFCPGCGMIDYRDFYMPSNKMLSVIDRVNRLLSYGANKSSKILVLYDNNNYIRDYYSSALRGLNVPHFSFGEHSNSNSIRTFIRSNTRMMLISIGALNERFFFPPNSHLLITCGVKRDVKDFILSCIQTIGEEDTLGSNFFIAKNSIEEVIANCDAQYSIDLMYGMLTVASFLPDD